MSENDRVKTISQSDQMDPARAQALLASLGLQRSIEPGDVLPPFFHQIYFWSAQLPAQLGRDGHPKVGGLIPNMGLPRRMWAGGRLAFDQPLRAGQAAVKTSVVESTQQKRGRSGPFGMVTLRHEIRQHEVLCVTEWQDLVYRQDPRSQAPAPIPHQARRDEEDARDMVFDSTLLFRYSALTFNGHRIHYDADYAKSVEGYNGLVVHGPLLAQLLMLQANEALGELKWFSFRATSPLMHFETATLCRRGSDFWVRAEDGRLVMQATADEF